MPYGKWLDGIVGDNSFWMNQHRRPLIVCPEPNGSGYERRKRDMRHLLRTEHGKFSSRVERLVRLFFNFHKEHEGEKPLLRCAFIDLSKKSAGPKASRNRVAEATRKHVDDLAHQIQSMKPTHILVAGKVAHEAFDKYLRARVKRGVAAIAYVPHPVARISHARFRQMVLTALRKSDQIRAQSLKSI
jgi:hypothetical protein